MLADVRIERGVLPEQGPAHGRLAIVAQYSTGTRVGRSFRELLRQLHGAGYAIVVVSTCEADGELDFGGELPDSAVVIRRRNLGYDFGSWATGLELVPEARRLEHVILANDSLAGPFAPLAPLIARFESTEADVFGLTDTYQYSRHLQSYFVGYRHGVLAEPPLRAFWSDIRHESKKIDIVLRNEVGLSRLLRDEAYVTDVAFRADELVSVGENPVIKAWWKLLDAGFPFVKREILLRPEVAPRGEDVARFVRSRFGVDVAEWL